MTYQELRQKYPKFIYEKFEYEVVGNNLEIKFYYSIPPDHKFTHRIKLTPSIPLSLIKRGVRGELENLIFHIGLSLMPSYWKSTCSPIIDIKAGHLSTEQILFWYKLFIKGMGEFYYRNSIDFTPSDFITITSTNITPYPPLRLRRGIKEGGKPSVLVPVGGGKDSTSTMEILKNHFSITPLVINPVPLIENVIKTAKVNPAIIVTSNIDPEFLRLNNSGAFLKGHFPINAFYGFTAVLAAAINKNKYIAISNERSSQEGNAQYLGYEINHQYSRTLEFETDLNSYLVSHISNIKYFSFLRSLYELQIAKLFSKYAKYFNVFSSCNRNFTIDPSDHPKNRWCTKCPKCVSTALLLCPFLGKDKITEIMGSYPPDLPENKKTLDDLLGKNPTKPFECVLTRAEANAAFNAVELGQLDQLGQLLNSWLHNPNMPKEFEKILKAAL